MTTRQRISAIFFFAFLHFSVSFAISAEVDGHSFSITINPNDSVDSKVNNNDNVVPNPEPLIPDSVASEAMMMTADGLGDEEYNLYSRPEPLYKTPEAMAFQQYGSFGTESSNGSVDISIPIHTISCRDLQIPISLHYGGTGIKVADEASWVGLGWDLSVGGCINVVAAGQVDFLTRNSPWSDYLELINLENRDVFQKDLDFEDMTVMEDVVHGMGERDFYSVNLLGRSFLFFINPYDGKPTVTGAEDGVYAISQTSGGGWIIKNVMGFQYEFDRVEYSLIDGAGMQKSATYLSSILTPEGITATFSYETTSLRGLPQPFQWYDVQRRDLNIGPGVSSSSSMKIPEYGSGSNYSQTEIQKPWLKSISTDNQTVMFELSDRTDYHGAKKIDRIRVVDLNGETAFLHHFNYGTFGHSTVGGSCPDINQHLIDEPRNGERLKFISFSNMSVDSKDSLTYEFEYDERYPLPLKTSAAIDFWGFYNGEENFKVNPQISDSRSLIPSLLDCTMDYETRVTLAAEVLAKHGACRFSVAERMQSGSLISIKYPTGGKSVFTFEPHRFKSSPAYPLKNEGYKNNIYSVEDINYPSDTYNPGPKTNQKIEPSYECKGFLTVTFTAMSGKKLRDLKLANASVTLQPMASPDYKKTVITLDSCSNANMEDVAYTRTFPVNLAFVPYMLIANLPAEVAYGGGSVKATIEYREISPNLESGGAGLRIASIENYDDNDALIGRRTFEYTNKDGSTSGKLIINAKAVEFNDRYFEQITGVDNYGNLLTYKNPGTSVVRINSGLNGGPAVTSAMTNGPVGYSRVTENEFDKDDNLIRCVVREYNVNTSEEVLPDLHLLSKFGGNDLIRETVLNADGDTLKTVDCQYEQKSSKTIKCNIEADDYYYARIGIKSPYYGHLRSQYRVRVYPYYSYWRVLSKTINREHTAAGIIETVRTCGFNTVNHLKSEETNTTGAFGTKTIYKYPVDYSILPYTRMIGTEFFIQGVPVETTSYEFVNGAYTESLKTKFNYIFRQNKAAMLRLGSVEESAAGGESAVRESFTYSDEDDTLVAAVKDSSIKRAYLWSYSHTCPVAVIEGASYSEVMSWLGSSLISSISKAKGNHDAFMTQVRNILKDKNVAVTTFSYKPLVGITSRIAPNGEKVTYEYDKFNRLSRILDHGGNVIQTFSYSYH